MILDGFNKHTIWFYSEIIQMIFDEIETVDIAAFSWITLYPDESSFL